MASGSGRTKGQAAERDRRYFGKSRLESREGEVLPSFRRPEPRTGGKKAPGFPARGRDFPSPQGTPRGPPPKLFAQFFCPTNPARWGRAARWSYPPTSMIFPGARGKAAWGSSKAQRRAAWKGE